MELALIAAVASNGIIGRNGTLPWKPIKEDMKHFKDLTYGHPVIMGRKTYYSIPEKFKPLAGRKNIVLTKSGGIEFPREVAVCTSVEEALDVASQEGNILYVIGGQNVYGQTIGLADRLEITELEERYDGDACFPEINRKIWKEIFREKREGYSFVSYGRR
ncbi:MAG: dihydrofolate reductase [archaeon]|nr:dihydrofolate reductase [archaeon]